MSPGLLQWDAIIEDLAPKLFRYFCSTFDRDVADDLVQVTLQTHTLNGNHQVVGDDGRFDGRPIIGKSYLNAMLSHR